MDERRKKEEKRPLRTNHLLLMGDFNPFAKSENEIHSWVQMIRVCITDTGIQFGILKCAVLNKKHLQVSNYLTGKECGIQMRTDMST